MARDTDGPGWTGTGTSTDDIVNADLIWAVLWGFVAATVASRIRPKWTLAAFPGGMIAYILLVR